MLDTESSAQNAWLNSTDNRYCRFRHERRRWNAGLTVNHVAIGIVHGQPVRGVAAFGACVSIERTNPSGHFVAGCQYSARIRQEQWRQAFSRGIRDYVSPDLWRLG